MQPSQDTALDMTGYACYAIRAVYITKEPQDHPSSPFDHLFQPERDSGRSAVIVAHVQTKSLTMAMDWFRSVYPEETERAKLVSIDAAIVPPIYEGLVPVYPTLC